MLILLSKESFFSIFLCNHQIIKIKKQKMKQSSLLNDIFADKKDKIVNNNDPYNVNKFLECFSAANRHKQIRILQIGGSKAINRIRKPFMTTQPIKKSMNMGLFNNQIIYRKKESEQSDKNLFIEPIRTVGESMENPSYRESNRKFFSSTKETVVCTEFATSCSPRKTKAFVMKKKNLEELPASFFRKNRSQNHDQKNDNKIDKTVELIEQMETVSKSVNLLHKFGFIEQEVMEKEVPKTAAIQFKRRPAEISRKTPQQIAEEERKAKLEMKKQISQDYAKPFNPPTNISANSYIIFQPNFSENKKKKERNALIYQGFEERGSNKKFPHSHKVLASFNSRTAVEVASLTKIMTCILSIQLCEKYDIDPKKEKIMIGKFESNIGGTSAQISEGEIYVLEDLFYGLMLPSGNDASVAIAVWGGKTLLSHEKSEISTHKKKDFYNRFIREMNTCSKRLNLHKTTYANSHGLVNPENKSCAFDMAILCEHAMNNRKFRSIVSCRSYKTQIKYTLDVNGQRKQIPVMPKVMKEQTRDDEQEEGEDKDLDSNEETEEDQQDEFLLGTKSVQWENTHLLLQQKPKQYIGIKTGITTAAGPCLASCVELKAGRYLIIIVLNCDKMSMRFKDTENLRKWVCQREGISMKKKEGEGCKKIENPSTLQI